MMSNVDQFVSKIFGVDLEKKGLHFLGTTDRTRWYRIVAATSTMYTPGPNVLRVNPLELDKFLGAVDSFLHFGVGAPEYDWEHLNLYDYATAEEVAAGLEMLRRELPGTKVAVDIETRDLSWDDNRLLAIGFATDSTTCHAFYNIPPQLYPLLNEVLTMPDVNYIWHNGKFDCEHLWYTCKVKARVDNDTLLKHFVQISEKKGTHGLKTLGPLYLQAPQWDDELDDFKRKFCRNNKIKLADFKYDMIPTEVLIPYMHRDCIATYRLDDVFEQLKEPGTDWIYHQLCRASNVFTQVELNGATVNPAQFDYLQEKFEADLEEADALVAAGIAKFWNPQLYSQETGAKYSDEFSMKSPKKLKWMLTKATGLKLESTDAATIENLIAIAEDPNAVVKFSEEARSLLEGIKRSRVASKYLDTYVVGLREATCCDGKVRSIYNLHGTETGRLSSSNPNAQNIPRKNKDVKNLFIAGKNKKLVQLDYSQCELRVLGVLSKDPFLIESYESGADLHANVARKIFGDDFTSEQRTQCKTINFGK